METSRLNIVFQGINVEDGARVCAPNFEVFYQKEEINKSRMNFKMPAPESQSTSLEKDACKKQTRKRQTHWPADLREQRDNRIHKDLVRKSCEQMYVAWFIFHWPSVCSLWLITQHTCIPDTSPHPWTPHTQVQRGEMFDLNSWLRTQD